MKISVCGDEPRCTELPKGAFLARRDHPTDGALYVIAPSYAMSGVYHALSVEARRGECVGACYTNLDAGDIRQTFYLVNAPITLQNEFK